MGRFTRQITRKRDGAASFVEPVMRVVRNYPQFTG